MYLLIFPIDITIQTNRFIAPITFIRHTFWTSPTIILIIAGWYPINKPARAKGGIPKAKDTLLPYIFVHWYSPFHIPSFM
jgi:hypothetical protein